MKNALKRLPKFFAVLLALPLVFTAALALAATDIGANISTGTLTTTGNVSIGGNIIMPTNTAGYLLIGDDTKYRPVVIGGDATLAGTGVLTIANNAVTAAKINDGAVTTAKILDGTIGTADIADDAVTQVKLSAGAGAAGQVLTTNGAGVLSWSSSTIADNSVTNAKMADDAVNTAEIVNGAVTSAKIASGAVDGERLAGNAVVSSKISDGTIVSADIADGTIVAGDIANDTITTTQLTDTLTFADGNLLNLAAINASGTGEGLILPQAANVSVATAEGQISWDADDDKLYIGKGGGQIAEIGSPVLSVFGRTGAVTAQSNDYTWAQINKTVSSLADITTRSATDLTSGNLDIARMPLGGNWAIAPDNLNINSDTLVVTQANKRVGIGKNNPEATLDVKGTLRLSGATSGYVGFAPAADAGSTTYTLPASPGSNGYFLTSDGAGGLSWTTQEWTDDGGLSVLRPADGVAKDLVLGGIDPASSDVYLSQGGPSVFNEQGHSANDLRVEGDTDQYLLSVDASADKVGIGVNAPTHKLHVNGPIRIGEFATGDTCDGLNKAVLYYDSDIDMLCFCNGTNFIKVTDGTNCN